MFRIRQQRVMAIIALRQMEADAEASGYLKADEEDEFQVLMETEVYDCTESQGVGERHVVTSASFPVQGVSFDNRFADSEAQGSSSLQPIHLAWIQHTHPIVGGV